MKILLALALLALAGCAQTTAAESAAEMLATAPTAICAVILTQQAQTLAQLKASLAAAP